MAKGKKNTQSNKLISAQVEFALINIELIESRIEKNDSFSNINPSDYKFRFACDLNIKAKESIISILVEYEFFTLKDSLFFMKVQNDFTIVSIAPLLEKVNLNLLKEFSVYLADLSVVHSRGIQSLLIKDSPIAKLYIPFISSERMKEKLVIKKDAVIIN